MASSVARLALVVALGLLLAVEGRAMARVGVVTRIEGGARAALLGTAFRDIGVGTLLHSGDSLKSAPGGTVVVRLDQGGELRLRDAARVRILPEATATSVSFELEYGRVFARSGQGDVLVRYQGRGRTLGAVGISGEAALGFDPKGGGSTVPLRGQVVGFAGGSPEPVEARVGQALSSPLSGGVVAVPVPDWKRRDVERFRDAAGAAPAELARPVQAGPSRRPSPRRAQGRDAAALSPCPAGITDRALEDLLARGRRLKRVKTEPAYAPPEAGKLFEFEMCLEGPKATLSVEPSYAQLAFAFAADWLSSRFLASQKIGAAVQSGLRTLRDRAVAGRSHQVAKDLVHFTRGVGRAVQLEGDLQLRALFAPGTDRIQRASIGKLAEVLEANGGDLEVPAQEALQLFKEFRDMEANVADARERFVCGILAEEATFLEEAEAAKEGIRRRVAALEGTDGCNAPDGTAEGRAELEELEEKRRELARLRYHHGHERELRRTGSVLANEGRWTLERRDLLRIDCGP